MVGTGVWTLDPVVGGCRFAWSEEVRLAAPLVGELAARVYRPILGTLMGRAMAGLRRHVIAMGPGPLSASPRS